MKTTYKVFEIVHMGKPTGLLTIRKQERIGNIEISSKVFESRSKNEIETKLKELKK